MMNRISLPAAAVILCILPIHAQRQENRADSAQSVIEAKERFENYRFGLSFTVPVKSLVKLGSRGIFRIAEFTSAADDSYYIAHTSFRIRDPADLKVLADEFQGSCGLPDLDPGADFRRIAECSEKIGLNDIEQKILYLRRGSLLHVLLVAVRSDSRQFLDEIFNSVRVNDKLYVPGD